MRYFAKKEVDNSFGGWYMPEIHETMFDVTYNTEKRLVDIEIEDWDSKIEKVVKKIIKEERDILVSINYTPKFDGIEYSEQEYNSFMKDVSEPNSELRFNTQGRLIVYHKKSIPDGMLNGKYDYETETWIDTATDLEKVQAQISEYSELDTPSTLKEMGTELANECMNMLIELRGMAYTLGNPATIEDRDLLVLPKPSEKLKQFKNKYNSIR